MDNMAAGWDRPQEDEFALCMLGLPSPYLKIAFPNRPPPHPAAVDLTDLPPRRFALWKRTFRRFLQRLTFKDPRPLILKSPTHTCRIRTLLEIFPDARFVHIVRNPYVVFPSTVSLWKTLWKTHGLQAPTYDDLNEYVLENFTHMYERLEQDRGLIPPAHLHEVKYEDLVADPIEQMRRLYDHLGLGGFNAVLPRFHEYCEANAGYKTNRYALSAELQEEISRRWGPVIERYGYEIGG
jgi:hypothetical protein